MKKRIAALTLALCVALALALPAGALETETLRRGVQVPYATVKAQLEGGTDYLDKYGVTRERVVAELSAHEHDSYYLGTRYLGGDHQSPNGDTSYNGYPGLNCAGFPAYVLRKCGLNANAAMADMRKGSKLSWDSGLPYDLLAGASNYYELVKYGHLVAYTYPSKAALLASGKCEKGDLLLRYYTNTFNAANDEDNHLMIFWGDTPSQDRIWHSNGPNSIDPISADTRATFVLIKFAPASPPVAGFEDVREKDWFAPAVAYASEHGLMAGITGDTFAPHAPLTRAQAVALVYRAAGKPEAAGEPPFADVPAGSWYADAASWAQEAGISSGVGNGNFGPGDKIRREDLACLFHRYAQSLGADTALMSRDLSAYRDGDRASRYALDALSWATFCGILSGDGDGLLNPQGTASRAEAAAMLLKFCEQYPPRPAEEE